jgi:hypothetical protein
LRTSRNREKSAAAPDRATIPVLVLGEVAKSVLSASERGCVLAVFRRSFYVRFGEDVVCFGPRNLGRGPLNALCALPHDLSWGDRGLVANSPVLRTQLVLRVNRYFEFDFNNATPWRPPGPTTFSVGELVSGLRMLAICVRRRPTSGLGLLIGEPCMGLQGTAPADDQIGGLLRAAEVPTGSIRHWLADALAGSHAPCPGLDALIGLGPGLTPSGDDFVCGALATLHHFGRSDIAGRLAEPALAAVSRKTNVISAAYLRCAAAGQASDALFEVLQSLLAGREASVESALDQLQAIGHTSGLDSLAGAVAVCASLCSAHHSCVRTRSPAWDSS